MSEEIGSEQLKSQVENDEPQECQNCEILKLRIKDLEEGALRNAAAMQTVRHMADEDVKRAKLFANQKLLESLLPVLDAFEMGLMCEKNENNSALYEGMKMVQDQFLSILVINGFEVISSLNKQLDPVEHEVIGMEHNLELENNIVLKVLQSGYKLNGRVLRAAKVIVNKI